MTIASFHLVRVAPRRAPTALARLALDRPGLHQVEGLRFFRLLGTARGSTTSASADLARTAMFAVWDGDAALDRFLATSPVAARWNQARESYAVRLRARHGHGRWRGVDVLSGLEPASGDGGPVAVLTRADVRLRSWAAFARAGVAVSRAVQPAAGLLAVVGVGEAPLGRQGTFSLWSSVAAMRQFADADPAHQEVVRRTREQGWYGEELFAAFEPYAAEGAWDGRDPLAG